MLSLAKREFFAQVGELLPQAVAGLVAGAQGLGLEQVVPGRIDLFQFQVSLAALREGPRQPHQQLAGAAMVAGGMMPLTSGAPDGESAASRPDLKGQDMSLNLQPADYDNDGKLDVLILRGGWEGAARLSLLRNRGGGR